MRIIAGEFRGRIISGGEAHRPTRDFVRQALFSILGGTLSGTFLDLYAGSGGVGLEARSRGATAVLVEREPEAVATIEANVKRLDIRDGVTIVPYDVMRFLKHPGECLPASAIAPFDVVFADPPYDYPLHAKLLRSLARTNVLGGETVVIVEASRRTRLKAQPGLALVRERTYGETQLIEYRLASERFEGDA